MTHRSRDCAIDKSKTMFSIKTDKVMEGANLKYRARAFGLQNQFSPIYREVYLPVDWPPPSPKSPSGSSLLLRTNPLWECWASLLHADRGHF